MALSSDGTYLAVGTWYDGPPHLYIYQRNDTQYQQMANPATMPADSVVGLAFLKN